MVIHQMVIHGITMRKLVKCNLSIPIHMQKLDIQAEIQFGAEEMKTVKGEIKMKNITWKYVKELKNPAAIDEFENNNNFSFPSDLKQILTTYNGGRPSSKYYDLDDEKDKEFKTLLSFNKSDIENIYKCFPLDSSKKSLIPFASDPAGNYFVIKNGKICFWNHETDVCKIISNSFTDFLQQLHD